MKALWASFKKLWLIQIVSTFLISVSCYGSTAVNKLDSLERLIKSNPEKNRLFELYCELADYQISNNPKSAEATIVKLNSIISNNNGAHQKGIAFYLTALYLDEINKKDSALIWYEKAIPFLKESKNENLLARSYTYKAGIIMTNGEFLKSIELYKLSEELEKTVQDERTILNNLTYLGVAYAQLPDYPNAIAYFHKALKLADKLNLWSRKALILMYLGSSYDNSANRAYALSYYEQSIEIAKEHNDTSLLIDAELYLGNGYYYNKDYTKAIELYENVIRLSEKSPDKIEIYAGAMGNLANTYTDVGRINESQEYQFKAIELFEQIGDKQGLCECYIGVGRNYRILKQYTKALEYSKKGLAIAAQMSVIEKMRDAYEDIALAYEELGDISNAFQNFKTYHQLSDSIYNDDNTRKMTELEMEYRYELQEKENKLIQQSKEELATEQLNHQKVISYISILGILVLGVLIIVVYKNSIQRKQNNKELLKLNNEISLKNILIQEKNNEITGSINYAKRIQSSFLTSETYIRMRLDDYFIFYAPRDIVSGDFYWVDEKNNQLYICAADCTGHGIPGAFMSLIGMSILNEIINSKNTLRHTDEIFNELRRIVILALNPEGATEEGKDGMDAVLCRFDFQKMEMEYSSANNPFYIIRNGMLLEFKADKMPVGKYVFDDKPFTRHTVSIEKGDCIYLFSDGYADQFGGEKGKKFKYSQFKELLTAIYHEPMIKQNELIKQRFLEWKGNAEQVDDVCVIGIRV